MIALPKKRRKKLQAKLDSYYGYRQYSDDDVEVRDSKRRGSGVFAMRQFLPGELILEVRGQLLRKKRYAGSTYVMELDEKWYLEPSIPAAFLNHSCNPNAELVQLTKHTLAIVALVNIEPESEITFDYQWEAADWLPRCGCGAPNCRGWVVEAGGIKKMQKYAKKAKK